MSVPHVMLCAAVRTAIGTYGGTLKEIPATELGAAGIRVGQRAGMDKAARAMCKCSFVSMS